MLTGGALPRPGSSAPNMAFSGVLQRPDMAISGVREPGGEAGHSGGGREVTDLWRLPPPSDESIGGYSDTPCDPMEYLPSRLL